MEATFTEIYESKKWGNNHHSEYSGSSGSGSDVHSQSSYITFLRKFITEKCIQSVVDVGCGDFRCGPSIYDDLNVHYVGYDVYRPMIEYHARQYAGSDKYTFKHLDVSQHAEQIAGADLCILKDVLQHWSTESIYAFLDRIVQQQLFCYILICNCCTSSNTTTDTAHIEDGGWRILCASQLPLQKYGPQVVHTYGNKEAYGNKEVSVITLGKGLFQKMRPVAIVKACNYQPTRVGSEYDGGYIFMTNVVKNAYDAFISCGVGNNIQFENDMLQLLYDDSHDLVCHAYDGTVRHLPHCAMQHRIHFHKLNIGGRNTDTTTDLKDQIERYEDILLKMDIEGGEYEWLESLTDREISKFKQILIEIHSPWSSARKMKCIHKLLEHHAVVHIHGNNYASVTKLAGVTLHVPDVLELTLMRKSDVIVQHDCNELTYPTAIDRPNKPSVADIPIVFAAKA